MVLATAVQFNGASKGHPNRRLRAIAPRAAATARCGRTTLRAMASMSQVRPKTTHAESGSFFISAFHAGALRIGAACTSTERAGVRWGSICE